MFDKKQNDKTSSDKKESTNATGKNKTSIKLEKGKALLICGEQGSGKSTLAQAVAKKHGTVKTVNAGALSKPAEFGAMFTDNPDTVIVEEFAITRTSLATIKPLIADGSIIVRQKGVAPVSVQLPNFIFVTGDKDALKLAKDERRFVVVET